MAQHDGYEYVAHDSYDAFRAATINQGWNVDFSAGNQCFDLVALLYYQYNLRLITKPGGGGAKYCWLVSRAVNSQPPFTSLTGKENIRRGDIIVLDGTNQYPSGHICFADEDFNGTNTIASFGQTPSKHGINGTAQVDNISLSLFLGIFRNTEWEYIPPTPPTPTEEKKKHFPWPVAWSHWDNFKH